MAAALGFGCPSTTPKVPRFVAEFDRVHVGLGKGNVFMTLYLDQTTFARDGLFKVSAILLPRRTGSLGAFAVPFSTFRRSQGEWEPSVSSDFPLLGAVCQNNDTGPRLVNITSMLDLPNSAAHFHFGVSVCSAPF
jgi:hypothetical protein